MVSFFVSPALKAKPLVDMYKRRMYVQPGNTRVQERSTNSTAADINILRFNIY